MRRTTASKSPVGTRPGFKKQDVFKSLGKKDNQNWEGEAKDQNFTDCLRIPIKIATLCLQPNTPTGERSSGIRSLPSLSSTGFCTMPQPSTSRGKIFIPIDTSCWTGSPPFRRERYSMSIMRSKSFLSHHAGLINLSRNGLPETTRNTRTGPSFGARQSSFRAGGPALKKFFVLSTAIPPTSRIGWGSRRFRCCRRKALRSGIPAPQ